MSLHMRCGKVFTGIFVIIILFGTTGKAVGQTISGYSVASTYPIADEEDVAFGDIIAYDKTEGAYRRASVPGDENMFGVTAERPLLVHRSEAGGIPVVQSGVVLVNVTLENGSVSRGDYITSSRIPGKGQKVTSPDTFVLGVAQAALTAERGTSTTTPGGEEVVMGKIPVQLSIGPLPSVAEEKAGEDRAEEEERQGQEYSEATILNIIQYVVAAFVAVGSVYIAFHNFMPNINRGVSAVGRNPRAKSSIQSMVVFNAVIVLLISIGGLFLAVGIIMLPL